MRSISRKLSGLGTAMPTLAELQSKLDSVRREVRNLTVMGLDPNQTPELAALIKELERSARAEMRLRTRALAHAKGRQRPTSACRSGSCKAAINVRSFIKHNIGP
jgi:hypothetical protein